MAKQTLGMKITALRKQMGMTQLELAEKMGVTDKAVSKWERDLSCPDVSSLPRLAEIFDVSVDELMQARTKAATDSGANSPGNILTLVFRAVALAMGVSVTALSALKKLDSSTGFTLLGIGLACAGMSLFRKEK